MNEPYNYSPGEESAYTSIADVSLGARGRLLNLVLRSAVKTHLRNLQPDADGVAKMRQRVDRIVARISHGNDGLNVDHRDIGGVPCETLSREDHDQTVVFYIHGGAFIACSPQSHWGITRPLATKSGSMVVAVDYRLAPEHPFPAALNDVVAVYGELISLYGASQIAVAGDSAGGNLVLALLHAAQTARMPMPACAVCLSPLTDFAGTGNSLRNNVARDPMLPAERMLDVARMYLNGVHPRDPTASPLYGDFAGFPPMLFHVGDTEILLDDTLRVVARARQAGIETHLRIWPGFPHVFHVFSEYLEGARVALDEISDFVVARLRYQGDGA